MKTNPINIRPAEPCDIPLILKIINHEITNSTSVYDYKERSLEQQQLWFKNKIKDDLPVLVVEFEGNLAGYASFSIYRPWEGYKYSVEHSIYIAEGYQGKGIGKALMKGLVSIARLKGYHTMVAGIDSQNTLSIAFHEGFGFKEVGRLKEIGRKFNQWLDLVFLQLIL